MKIECIGDYIIVKEIKLPEIVSAVSIIIPDSQARGVIPAEVIASGPGIHQPYQFVKNEVHAGEIVIFLQIMGNPVRLQGEHYNVLRQSQIIAKLNLEEEEEMPNITDEIVVGNRKYFVPAPVKESVKRALAPYANNSVPVGAEDEVKTAVEPPSEKPEAEVTEPVTNDGPGTTAESEATESFDPAPEPTDPA